MTTAGMRRSGEFGEQLAVEVQRVRNGDDAFHPASQEHIETGLELRTIVLQVRNNREKSGRTEVVLNALRICVQYGSVRSNTITPSVWLRLLRRERACRFGRYPSRRATSQMRLRVRSGMRSTPAPLFRTMETVVTEKPLSPATSRMVIIAALRKRS